VSRTDPRLEEIAQAITDETPVDWTAAHSGAGAQAAVVRNMQTLAEIARMGRRAAMIEPDLPPLFRWGHLNALEKLGEGSFAEVFRAWDTVLSREVALKLRRQSADGGSSRRWLEESRRLARVRHPNVLVVHGAAVNDVRAGIWTDLVSGGTLEELLEERGPFGAREAALIGVDLCGALAAVHAAGMVHGDVKTRNVMRVGETGVPDGSGRIVLMDFGSASEIERGELFPLVTPLASAPEILAGAPAAPSTDLYSLGVLLYRLVTGRYPVEAGSISELEAKLGRRARTPLRSARPDLPADFVRVVEQAMALEPGERFASAAEMERALASTLPLLPEPRRGAGSRLPAAVAGAVLLVVGAVVTLVWTSADRSARSHLGEARGAAGPVGGATVAGRTAAAPTPQVAPPASGGGAAPLLPRAPEVEVSLERVTDGSYEALRTGDRVDPGDRLSLALSAREPVHAYVLNEDERGGIFVLFPIRDHGATNPLAAGVRHRLPGAAAEGDLDWEVTSAGGKETFLILVGREPVAAIEAALGSLPAARLGAPVSYAPLPPAALGEIRGVGGMTARRARDDRESRGRLDRLAQSLSDPSRPNPLWIRLIVLDNPGS